MAATGAGAAQRTAARLAVRGCACASARQLAGRGCRRAAPWARWRVQSCAVKMAEDAGQQDGDDRWERCDSIDRVPRALGKATEQGKIEPDDLNVKLSTFSAEQNAKSEAVLLGMAAQSDKALLGTVFKTWWTYKVKQKHEQAIHKKFKKEIDDAQRIIMEYRQARAKNIRGALQRSFAGLATYLQTACFRVWAKDVQDEKEDRAGEAAAVIRSLRRDGALQWDPPSTGSRFGPRLVQRTSRFLRATAALAEGPEPTAIDLITVIHEEAGWTASQASAWMHRRLLHVQMSWRSAVRLLRDLAEQTLLNER